MAVGRRVASGKPGPPRVIKRHTATIFGNTQLPARDGSRMNASVVRIPPRVEVGRSRSSDIGRPPGALAGDGAAAPAVDTSRFAMDFSSTGNGRRLSSEIPSRRTPNGPRARPRAQRIAHLVAHRSATYGERWGGRGQAMCRRPSMDALESRLHAEQAVWSRDANPSIPDGRTTTSPRSFYARQSQKGTLSSIKAWRILPGRDAPGLPGGLAPW
jgi:hypothetical protein